MTAPLAVLAAAATGVQVGAAIVATRFVVAELGPASLALLRYVVGFLCLVPPVLLAARSVRFARRDLVPMALLGIGQFGILIALLNWGLNFVPAARAALLFATFPLMTMLLAAALGRERLTAAKAGGVLLSILGVGLALGDAALGRGDRPLAWLGEAAVLASAFCGALCGVLYRPYLRRYPALPVGAYAMLAAVGFLALPAAAEGLWAAWPRVSAAGWGAVLFIGVSSGVGYWLWLWALAHATPTRVAVFLSLSPVTAALLGAWLLAEPLTVATAAGAAAVIGGQVADCVAADALLDRLPATTILSGDKGYDSDAVRRKIESKGAAPNIPPKANRRWKNCFSPILYRDRNAIERMFGRIKDFRRIATRYDRLAQNFLAAVCLAATICYWL